MTCVDVCVTYSIEVPEIDEIQNECDDPDLVDDKINDVIERIDEVIRDVKEVLKVLKEQL